MNKISIIIPAHNEEKRIGKTLEKYIKYFRLLKKSKKIDFEIIVVINGTTDNTRKIVEKYKCKELIMLEFEQGGKGFAIIEGFKNSLKRKNDLIGFVDADMATSPEEYYNLIKGIENTENIDGVIANRWDKKSIITTRQNLLRRIMSRGFNIIVRALFLMSYRDTQCGAKIFKRKAIYSVINNLNLNSKWAFDIEIIYKLRKNNFKIKEIATIWEDKRESKLKIIKVPIQMFSAIIRLRLLYSPFKFIVRVYDKMPEKLKIHNL